MTSQEARQKWCPFARVAFNDAAGNGEAHSYNRLAWTDDTDPCPPEARRIANDCMAWRTLGDGSGGWCGMAGGTQHDKR